MREVPLAENCAFIAKLSLALLCLSHVCFGDTLSPDVLRLTSARRQAAAMLEKTRNYTCIETVDREKISTQESVSTADVIRVEVAYVNGREVYALPGKRSFSNDELAQIVGHGFTATGLFAAFARGVFLNSSGSQITFGAAEALEGTAAFRYDFQSALGSKSWNVQSGQQSGYVDEKGSFWLDSQDLRLLRMTVSAANIPLNLPYIRILVSIDYSLTKAQGESALLPQAARVEASSRSGDQWKNRIDFSQCHRFEAKALLVTDAPSEEMVPTAFGSLLTPGLELPVDLVTAVDVKSAAESMPIEAVTARAIEKGDVSLPAGSRLHGKIRRIVSLHDGYLVSLEFDTIDSQQGEIPFVAMLMSATRSNGLEILKGSRRQQRKQRCKGLFGPELAREECGPAVPGVVNFLVTKGLQTIPAGTRMSWKTGGLEAPPERPDR